MCCMYATYGVIQSNRNEATEQTGPKLEITHVTFHPENGAWHIAPSCVVCMPHMKWSGQIRSKPQSGHSKNFKWPMWFWPLIFWPGNSVRHIVTSWVECVSHMKRLGGIGAELQTGHGKNFERPLAACSLLSRLCLRQAWVDNSDLLDVYQHHQGHPLWTHSETGLWKCSLFPRIRMYLTLLLEGVTPEDSVRWVLIWHQKYLGDSFSNPSG